MSAPRVGLVEGFDYQVSASGCWTWLHKRGHRGYGHANWRGRTWMAHRMAWVLHNGPIPDALTVDHLCFVPLCVNPEHLRLLTLSENSRNQRLLNANICKRGHEFTEANTQWIVRRSRERPTRRCRACAREAKRQSRARLAAVR